MAYDDLIRELIDPFSEPLRPFYGRDREVKEIYDCIKQMEEIIQKMTPDQIHDDIKEIFRCLEAL
jgi:hypothetical protein